MLKRECGLTDRKIDDVRIMDNCSFVTIPFSDAREAIRRLNDIHRAAVHRRAANRTAWRQEERGSVSTTGNANTATRAAAPSARTLRQKRRARPKNPKTSFRWTGTPSACPRPARGRKAADGAARPAMPESPPANAAGSLRIATGNGRM
ncbi:MAG: DbpA RNA binding domain-containing protein [Alistipes onderdonkii]